MTPTILFNLTEIVRVEIDGTEYVVYSEWGGDDDYVATSDDFDGETDETDYSLWCAGISFPADEDLLRAVARLAGMESVSSSPGVRVYASALRGINDPVVVETMPAYRRASHDAAGNSGRYPRNGAERFVVARERADYLVEDDSDWTSIVRDATEADADRYGVRIGE